MPILTGCYNPGLSERLPPVILLLSFGSGAAALIYEIVWFQLLELVVGSTAVSLGVLLATFMGGTCLGSLLLPRLVSSRLHPLRAYAAIEAGIAVLGILVLRLTPFGYGLQGFLPRGIVAAACLLPPTLLMGATLPALARSLDEVSQLGFLYGANLAGAVFGCLLSGFYLLREYDVSTATHVAMAINAAVAGIAVFLSAVNRSLTVAAQNRRTEPPPLGSGAVYLAIAISGLCALAAEAIWTRMLGLLFGASVYALAIILAVFLTGLGIGGSVGALLCRSLARPRLALGWCQLLLAAAIAWTAYNLSASLPYWPINPQISSNIWFTFELDLDRAFWALLPPTLLWGASFPLALAAAQLDDALDDPAKLMSRVYAANTLGAIVGALAATLLLVPRVGSQRAEQMLIALSTAAGLLLVLRSSPKTECGSMRPAPFAPPRNSPAQPTPTRPDSPELPTARGAEPPLSGFLKNSPAQPSPTRPDSPEFPTARGAEPALSGLLKNSPAQPSPTRPDSPELPTAREAEPALSGFLKNSPAQPSPTRPGSPELPTAREAEPPPCGLPIRISHTWLGHVAHAPVRAVSRLFSTPSRDTVPEPCVGTSADAARTGACATSSRASVGEKYGRTGTRLRWGLAALLAVGSSGFLIRSVPPISKVLIAYGRYAATWVGKGDIVYAGEGIDSSVAVSSFPNGALTFHVAGKIQASNVPRDMRLQRMLGHLTTLTAASPRSVLVIGCGAGITAGAVSIDPRVERETIVEIEPLVPQAAAAYFGEPNFDVLRNPKVQVRIDDGRHYLLTSKEHFDGITVDPLDPWVKGAANLYTEEFLEAMKRSLNPGGVVTMYIQLFETNLDAVKSSLATFFEVFPNATVWGNPYQGQGHDMVLLGRVEPLRIDLDEMEQRFGYRESSSRIPQSLAEVGIDSPVDLFATYAGRASDLTQWLKGAAINRDRNLRMQYLAGLGLNLDDSAAIYAGMLAYRRFPEDLFTSAEGRVYSLREAIRRER